MRADTNHHAGLAAETIVMNHLCADGHQVIAQRWRGPSGELDIISRSAGKIVVTEVKKSQTHEQAIFALGARQQQRIMAATAEYLAEQDLPMGTDLTINLATVDATGDVGIHQNILM